MISFHYEFDFHLESEDGYSNWIQRVIESEGYQTGEVNYIFCGDEYLLELHKKHLNKDSYTDIITFDYSQGNLISGDIFISIERVRENAVSFNAEEDEELLRVMAHGVLHMCGYRDKETADIELMRKKELEKIDMFHVEQ